MREVIRVCGHVWDQLARGSVVAAKEHGGGSWYVGVDIVAELQVHDVTGHEPGHYEEPKGNVARYFVAEIAEEFCDLQIMGNRSAYVYSRKLWSTYGKKEINYIHEAEDHVCCTGVAIHVSD